MKSDSELLKTTSVICDDGIIYITPFVRFDNLQESLKVVEISNQRIKKILDTGIDFDIFLDLRQIKKLTTMPKSLREKYADMADDDRINKIAILISSSVLKVIANYFLRALSKKGKKYKLFTAEKEALEWLKDKNDLIKDFKVSFIEDDVLEIKVLQTHENIEDALKVTDLVEEKLDKIFLASPGKRFGLLINLLEIENFSKFPDEIRKRYGEISQNKKIRKIALLGQSHLMKIFANLVATLIGRRGTFRFFSDRKDAASWLRE